MKEKFVEEYNKKTGDNLAKINRKDPKQVKKFIKNLKKHKLISLFRESVKDAESEYSSEEQAMAGLSGLFDNIDE